MIQVSGWINPIPGLRGLHTHDVSGVVCVCVRVCVRPMEVLATVQWWSGPHRGANEGWRVTGPQANSNEAAMWPTAGGADRGSKGPIIKCWCLPTLHFTAVPNPGPYGLTACNKWTQMDFFQFYYLYLRVLRIIRLMIFPFSWFHCAPWPLQCITGLDELSGKWFYEELSTQ